MSGRFNEGMKSSASDEWQTPRWLFELLDRAFSFTLDAAASSDNALCRTYLTEADDALSVDWTARNGHGAVWLNPPYSKIDAFTAKAAAEARKGLTVVCLVPCRPDTRWWASNVRGRADRLIEIEGRLKFGGARSSAPFPSALAIYETRVPGVQWSGTRHGVLSARVAGLVLERVVAA